MIKTNKKNTLTELFATTNRITHNPEGFGLDVEVAEELEPKQGGGGCKCRSATVQIRQTIVPVGTVIAGLLLRLLLLEVRVDNAAGVTGLLGVFRLFAWFGDLLSLGLGDC